ncbi:bifunctional short chain isoprenyl diphosphate synthase [Natronomonas pharaonis DSM 2160]|uniref:Geranylfarnesyl diphosphate synthase n=1 Tax=Natronomonas pharaonis (strain ATCC 35678 / DSM 2160 / CIP 103997 / JCM 8858 / NBRC 14720 / NCIMB 2260 / Gabara) TaxID=348780 RepID=GFPS_NATPD|nr:polyprenyl synthetase family protein [Natronomonas pharaonis]Q3IPL1.1 RecName: Full=Geranylfarnesyl diphosphate synthase; Short=GFPS; AltName: Full=Farnesylgeranyl diphosphate synthase; Short=FGPP synthase [Natronomonas pharaonis DSM 2160]CAI49939.1 bifunctional short chain isoprenyl diphosphate synthase [Natronomonas pharaonis DSM 2160]
MTSADHVESAIAERREIVNEAVSEQLPVQKPERLYSASRYLLDAGGKRLRPTILLLAAESLADVEPLSADYRQFPSLPGDEVDVLSAAVSIEVIQSFTLIHDDIMDDDDLRRGVPAVHREYDLETAILAGDTLYSKAFEYMLDTGAPAERSVEALDELATTCTEICEGQALDVDFENRSDVTTEEYLEMVEFKTAVLYAAAASIPAILLGSDDETVEALHGYGLDIGRAFQIQDDLLDLTAPSDELGKQRGSDLVENKRTVITLHARDQGIDVEGLVSDDPSDAEIEAAVQTLEDAGSIDFAREMALDLVTSGKERLDVLPENEARQLLEDIADFLVERSY